MVADDEKSLKQLDMIEVLMPFIQNEVITPPAKKDTVAIMSQFGDDLDPFI